MITDYNRAAEVLRELYDRTSPSHRYERDGYKTAIALCERMARGELVERQAKPVSKHVCGLRGFAESGDDCPGCYPERQHPTEDEPLPYEDTHMSNRAVEPRQTAPVAEQKHPSEDERTHCERVVDRECLAPARVDLLLRERSAVRAECAAEIERLKARVRELEQALDVRRICADARVESERIGAGST